MNYWGTIADMGEKIFSANENNSGSKKEPSNIFNEYIPKFDYSAAKKVFLQYIKENYNLDSLMNSQIAQYLDEDTIKDLIKIILNKSLTSEMINQILKKSIDEIVKRVDINQLIEDRLGAIDLNRHISKQISVRKICKYYAQDNMVTISCALAVIISVMFVYMSMV